MFSLTWPAYLCKFIGIKESVCIRKEFNSHRTVGTSLLVPTLRLVAHTFLVNSTKRATPDVLELSRVVDSHLKSLVQSLPSYIEDTAHFPLQLEQMGPLPDDTFLVTLAVPSLSRTNIPHNESVKTKHCLLNASVISLE